MTDGVPRDVLARFGLPGSAALVTGAGSGIGRAVALAFAAAGAAVVAADIKAEAAADTAAGIRSGGGRAFALDVDVALKDSVEAMVARAAALAPRIDVLVNSAGISGEVAAPEQLDLAFWERMIATNLTGTFLCCQAIGARMIAGGVRGRIVNLASIAALHASRITGRAMTAYSASKAGVLMVTRTLAKEWGKHGIRVNAIAPGTIITPMTERTRSTPEQRDPQLAATPLGRFGEAAEVAMVALFLASEASSFITGQLVTVDGGLTL